MWSVLLAAVALQAAQVAPDSATIAEAVGLLEEQGFEAQVLGSSEMALEASMAAMTEAIQKRAAEAVPDDFLEQLRQVMRDHASATMRARMPELKAQAAKFYAQEFTRDELARLRQLSADPVAVKARARDKILAPKLMMLGIQTMREAQPELEAKINRLVAEYLAKQGDQPNS